MVGAKWLRPSMSDEMKERAMCGPCGQEESMEHILFTCTACGREVIWKLLREAWAQTGMAEIVPSWGSIMGAACVSISSEDGVRKPTAEKRWATLAIESARLIWKLRCERVIANAGAEFSEQEVRNRWCAEVDRRLSLERRVVALTPGRKRGRRAKALDAIWRPLLERPEDLPIDWVVDSGVLVGIKRGR